MSRYSDPSDAPWALLARHLAAEASASERADLRTWVQADPLHLQILATVTRAWERAGEVAAEPVLFSPADVEAAWLRFRPLLVPTTPAHVAEPAPPARLPWITRLRAVRWQVAAALAAVVGSSYLLLSRLTLRPPEAIANYTSAGQRQLVHLPDGSRVWLNAHSRLHYRGLSPTASHGVRAVQLAGEAYFEVVHNPDRPFMVNTATARVRAAGTAFNVRAYAAEDSVEVSVLKGEVWLVYPAQADSILLTTNTRAALRAADAPGRVVTSLRRAPTANQNFRAWQTDTLRFQDAPVAQVAQALRATFGTAVSWRAASLGQCRFTGTFAHPQPAQVLAVLAAATASRLSSDGHGGYVLDGTGCPPPAPTASTLATPAPRL